MKQELLTLAVFLLAVAQIVHLFGHGDCVSREEFNRTMTENYRQHSQIVGTQDNLITASENNSQAILSLVRTVGHITGIH